MALWTERRARRPERASQRRAKPPRKTQTPSFPTWTSTELALPLLRPHQPLSRLLYASQKTFDFGEAGCPVRWRVSFFLFKNRIHRDPISLFKFLQTGKTCYIGREPGLCRFFISLYSQFQFPRKDYQVWRTALVLFNRWPVSVLIYCLERWLALAICCTD